MAKGPPADDEPLVATRSFGAGVPLAQKHAALVAHRDELTLIAVFGELERPRRPRDPVSVAVFDLQTGEWLTAEVDWSCGPRTAVGYTASGYADGDERSLLFYGGRLRGKTLDGLFIKALGAEALFGGSDVTRLDRPEQGKGAGGAGLANPGPRADAVLAYDSLNRLVYLFGGTAAGGKARNDLWVFSRRDGTWTQLSDGTDPAAPPKVLAGGLALSPVDGSVIVIAGSPARGRQGSSWRWANGVWTAERAPAVP